MRRRQPTSSSTGSPARDPRPTAPRRVPAAPQPAPASLGSLITCVGGAAVWLCSGCGVDGDAGLSTSLTRSATAAAVQGLATGEPPSVALPPLPPLTGDRLVYRFCDHAGEAMLDLRGGTAPAAQSLRDRLLAFDSPYKMVSPYSGLRGDAALRVIEVAVAEPMVEKYPRAVANSAAPAGEQAPRFDPVWNRYRGVYESKLALFAPAPACYRYRVALPAHGVLSWNYAAIPSQRGVASGAVPLEFSVLLDGQRLWTAQVGRTAQPSAASGSASSASPASPAGHWIPARIDLPAEAPPATGKGATQHELSFCTNAAVPSAVDTADAAGSSKKSDSPSTVGTAVWGSPELWSHDEGAAGPNVLLVLIDTLRADALSAMPRLNEYAHGGVAFSQAITGATWTRPALLGLLGGDLATSVGQSAEEMIPSERDRKRFYALDRRLIPRVLRDAGYKVASIGNNFFLLGYPQIGLSLGFDEVADVRHPVEDTPAISRAAIAFLQQHQRQSFFLQLHYDAPHWPYTPPAEHLKGITDAQVAQLMGLELPAAGSDGATAKAMPPLDPQARAYLGEAAYADAQLSSVLAELTRLGLRDRTLVIVVGDHGEIFDPRHNHYVAMLKQPTLYHHGWSAYDEILRVPLVLSMPGRLPAATTVPAQVRLIDVAPTVLELLGLSAWRAVLPSGPRGSGQSLLPLIFASGGAQSGGKGAAGRGSSDDARADRPAYTEGQNIRALRTGGYLYLRRGDARLQRAQGNDGTGPTLRVSEELYDIVKDPYQHNDLLAAYAPKPGGKGAPADPLADAQMGPVLSRLREEFARYTPQPPERGLPLTHLMLAPDPRAQHVLSGTLISSDLALSVQGVRGGEVVPRAPGRIDVKLHPGGVVDILVDPGARLELALARDGLQVASREVLLGPFSLPLLNPDGGAAVPTLTPSGDPAPIVIDGAMLDRLSGSYAPVPGERGEVLLWRDQTAPGVAAASSAARGPSGGGEVETLMRDWGYARPTTGSGSTGGTAPATPPASPTRTADGGTAR